MVAQKVDPSNGLPEFVGDNVGQVARTTPMIRTEQYAEIQSFEDALAVAQAAGLELISSEDLGDGFGLGDKGQLVGVPMVCLSVSYNADGDKGEYMAFRCVTQTGAKVAFADGSTGLFAQVKDYMDNHDGKFPVVWKHGLRRSDFTYTDDKGVDRPATTFYLDTAK